MPGSSEGRRPLERVSGRAPWSKSCGTRDWLRIGWDEYAEYTVDPREGIIDVAIGPMDEDEAAAAFILSVLPGGPRAAARGGSMLPTGTSLLVLGVSGAGKSTTAGSLRAVLLAWLAVAVAVRSRRWTCTTGTSRFALPFAMQLWLFASPVA